MGTSSYSSTAALADPFTPELWGRRLCVSPYRTCPGAVGRCPPTLGSWSARMPDGTGALEGREHTHEHQSRGGGAAHLQKPLVGSPATPCLCIHSQGSERRVSGSTEFRPSCHCYLNKCTKRKQGTGKSSVYWEHILRGLFVSALTWTEDLLTPKLDFSKKSPKQNCRQRPGTAQLDPLALQVTDEPSTRRKD